MALQFYVDGKSWQEKMLDREKWHKMGANLATGLGMGVRAGLDAFTPLGKAYKGYLKKQKGRDSILEGIKGRFELAIEEGAGMDQMGGVGAPTDMSLEDYSKLSDSLKNKRALQWASFYDTEAYGQLGLGDDYKYSPKDFKTLKKRDYKTSDAYQATPEYLAMVEKVRKREELRDPNYLNKKFQEKKRKKIEAQQQGNKQAPYKNLLQMVGDAIKGGGPGSPAGPYNTNSSNRGGPGSPGGQYANRPDKPSSLSDIDITESDEYAKYRHGNYAIPKQYDITDPNMFGNLLPSQQNTLLNLQPNEMEGVREYSKTPGIQGLLQRLFPGGKAGYHAGDYVSQEDLLNQMEEARKLNQMTTMRNVYGHEPMEMGNQ